MRYNIRAGSGTVPFRTLNFKNQFKAWLHLTTTPKETEMIRRLIFTGLSILILLLAPAPSLASGTPEADCDTLEECKALLVVIQEQNNALEQALVSAGIPLPTPTPSPTPISQVSPVDRQPLVDPSLTLDEQAKAYRRHLFMASELLICSGTYDDQIQELIDDGLAVSDIYIAMSHVPVLEHGNYTQAELAQLYIDTDFKRSGTRMSAEDYYLQTIIERNYTHCRL